VWILQFSVHVCLRTATRDPRPQLVVVCDPLSVRKSATLQYIASTRRLTLGCSQLLCAIRRKRCVAVNRRRVSSLQHRKVPKYAMQQHPVPVKCRLNLITMPIPFTPRALHCPACRCQGSCTVIRHWPAQNPPRSTSFISDVHKIHAEKL